MKNRAKIPFCAIKCTSCKVEVSATTTKSRNDPALLQINPEVFALIVQDIKRKEGEIASENFSKNKH